MSSFSVKDTRERSTAGSSRWRFSRSQIAHLRQIEELSLLLIDGAALLHTGPLLQGVVVAEATLLQQFIDRFATLAAEIPMIAHAMLFRTAITAVVAVDNDQWLDLQWNECPAGRNVRT